MSNYDHDDMCTDDIDNNIHDGDFQNMPTSQPNFRDKQFDPSNISSIHQIPTAYIVTSERGPVVNINGETFPITLFNPRIINELQNRQAMEEQNAHQMMDVPNRDQFYDQGYGRLEPVQYQEQMTGPPFGRNAEQQHMFPMQYQQSQRSGHQPVQKHKNLIDLTEVELSDNSCTSHTRKQVNNSILTPFLTGWNKTILIIVLLSLFFNPYIDTFIQKVPYLSNPYILLGSKILLIAIINHVITGYLM